jgi:hypothetical protein
MFEFVRDNRVRTGQSGHAYVFDSMSGQSYIFNRPLPSGAQNQVQLVTNIHTHEVAVRKVSKQKPAVQDAHDLAQVPDDNEVRILDHLNALVRNPVYLLTGLTPRWSTCISHEKIAVQPQGRIPTAECLRISYWKLCNGGSVSSVISNWRSGFMSDNMEGKLFPVSFVARCIAQVCETLHFMYHAGHEALYHYDLHLGNIFVHYESDPGNDGLPNFYIGDFGWARTASEGQANSETWRNDRAHMYLGDGCSPPPFDERRAREPALGAAPTGKRLRWDVTRFLRALEQLTRHTAVPWTNSGSADLPNPSPLSEQAAALGGLVKMLEFVDAQDGEMAAHNPTSRPPSLVEVVRAAKRVEEFALKAEMYTEPFDVVAKWGELQLAWSQNEKAFVFASGERPAPPQTLDMTVVRAENYGRANIVGPWTLVDSE